MAGQIQSFMGPLLGNLNELEQAINKLIAQYRDEQARLDGVVTGLVTGAKSFVGEAAQAFTEAMQEGRDSLESHLAALESISEQIARGASNIVTASESAESSLITGGEHLSTALGQLTYEALERAGGDAVHAVLQDMAKTLGDAVHQSGGAVSDFFSGNFFGAADDVFHVGSDAFHLLADGWSLLGDLPNVLIQWGWDIYNALGDLYRWLWNQADAIVHRLLVPKPHPGLVGVQTAKYDLTGSSHNMQDLIRDIDNQYTQYGGDAPIGIRRIGGNQLLVTLAGLEMSRFHQTNNLPDALDAGLGDLNNPFALDVQAAIEDYLRHHPEIPEPVTVVVAGHSYGGIVAQQLALRGGGPGFSISNVITFGSPQVGPMVKNVSYTEYVDHYDPVPLLSWYKDGGMVRSLGLLPAVGAIAGINWGPMQVKQAFTGETWVPDVGNNPSEPVWGSQSAHSAYANSAWLGTQPIPFNVRDIGKDGGATTYYSTTPQSPINDFLLSGWTFLKDYATP